MAHKSFSELETELAKAKKLVRINGIYSHYKHPENLYKVLYLAIQEGTGTVCVIYEPEYHKGTLFVRDLENWLTKLMIEGKEIERFRLVKK